MINKIKSFFSIPPRSNSIILSVKNLDDFKYFNVAKELFDILKKRYKNCEIKFIGGTVRKLITGEKIDDIDIAINLDPQKIKEVLISKKIKFIETGVSHGTITVIIKNFKFEITSLRKDVNTDGRHAEVEFISDWEEDAKRRDFTFNAIYADIRGEVYDPIGGFNDLRNGIIKFIGDPDQRIQEDYIRILRYLRFYVQYGSNNLHHENTVKAIKKNLEGLTKISKERIIDELFKMMKLNNFNKLFEDDFCKFIFLSIFPQLRNFNRIKNFNKIINKTNSKVDKILMLSILLIDDSDSCDYFLYKYKLSNDNKKRILFIKDNLNSSFKKEFFSKNNLLKLIYLFDKFFVLDLLIFLFFVHPKKINKIENLISYIKETDKPKFPINAKFLKEEFNLIEGKELGDLLKKIEKKWIDNNFYIDKKILNLY